VNKRDALLRLAGGTAEPGYVPAAFFLHFDGQHHCGTPAVTRHLEYFRATGMDFLKIQYEHPWPKLPGVRTPADWTSIDVPNIDHYEEPLAVISGIVKAAKKDALIVVTLYSALMHAGHATSGGLVTEHLQQDPSSTARGLERIAESTLLFVRECVKRGVDGFYMSTQGGEAGRFSDPSTFGRFIKPSDLLVMNEAQRACAFNILHVCDYHGEYDDLSPYRGYPGHIVNCGTRLRSGTMTPSQIASLFGRPFMGGMDRHGILVTGTKEQISAEARAVCAAAPPRFILGADCTVPSDISWDNLKTAIEEAHGAGAMHGAKDGR
jgi:uroporphyrinogen decarboxylase